MDVWRTVWKMGNSQRVSTHWIRHPYPSTQTARATPLPLAPNLTQITTTLRLLHNLLVTRYPTPIGRISSNVFILFDRMLLSTQL